MYTTKLWIIAVLVGTLMLGTLGVAQAQGDSAGTLTIGQPVIAQVEPDRAVRYGYTVAQASAVTIQALSDSAQPVLNILQDGMVLAAEPNEAVQTTVTLTTFLEAGPYTVEVRTRSPLASTIILLVQGEVPVAVTPLVTGVSLGGEVNPTAMMALYTFNGLSEPAYLSIEGGQPGQGVRARLIETGSGSTVAVVDSQLDGARLTLPASGLAYQLEVRSSTQEAAEPFSICLIAASVGACQPGSDAPQTSPIQATADNTCRVTPNSSGGANLRQTASTAAPILVAIPASDSALVSGISPDGSFYNVVYGVWSGWVAGIAVTPSGDCAALAVIVPPPLPPTPTPIPPTPAPTQPSAPPPSAPPQPQGPCYVYFTAAELIYTRPEIDSAYIFDQFPATGELIPVGRWQADPSWWKADFGGWWLNALGTAGEVRGDCSGLPLVAWP